MKRVVHKNSASESLPGAENGFDVYNLFFGLAFFGVSVFLYPECHDRYLAPRFLFLSLALLICLPFLRRDLKTRGGGAAHAFDALLLLWYALNVASVFWAFSWSEAWFYTQKVSLLLLVYAFTRLALLRDAAAARRALYRCTLGLTWIYAGVVAVQFAMALPKTGLRNDELYAYVSGLSGNKGMAANFLFFLLVFNTLCYDEFKRKSLFWAHVAALVVLIVLLQVRTVYVALAAASLVYLLGRALADAGFRPIFVKRILPLGIAGIAGLALLLSFAGRGASLAERLNPATYLESASAAERRAVWYKTDLLNAEHFWWGVGAGSWKFMFPAKGLQGAFRLQEKNVVFTRAHNDYLEARSEMGMVGAVFFAALFLFAAGALLYVISRKTSDAEAKRAALSVLAGITGYCIIQYFDFPRERIEMQVVLALFLALAAHWSEGFWRRLGSVRLPAVWQSILLLVAAVCMVFNIVIGWNRTVGDMHSVRMLKAQSQNRLPEMLKEAQAAENRWNEYSDIALPLSWYAGVAYFRMNRFDEAAKSLGKAYELNPWSFQVINNYASALAAQKRYEQSIPLFEKAVEINPRYDEGKFNLAYAYFHLKNYPLAWEWLQKVDTIPNPSSPDEKVKNQRILINKQIFTDSILPKLELK